jgi:hypothetical protein
MRAPGASTWHSQTTRTDPGKQGGAHTPQCTHRDYEWISMRYTRHTGTSSIAADSIFIVEAFGSRALTWMILPGTHMPVSRWGSALLSGGCRILAALD